MGSRVSPRVTYWTGIWEPHREGLSREVAWLRRRLTPDSLVISFSAGQRSSLNARSRVIRLSGRRYIALRSLAAVVERTSDITHAFGAIDCWHLLRALGRRPTILTVAIGGDPLRNMYGRISIFAIQAPALRKPLLDAGVAPDRIRLVYPGIDLDAFQPRPLPEHARFRVLFASTPADAAEFDARGIPLIVDVARRHPDIDFVLLWRQWGNLDTANETFQSLQPPRNVIVQHRDAESMADVYGDVHAVICCYQKGFGKTCPNSVMEALACGRPALVTEDVGLASVVDTEGCGVVAKRSSDSVASALEILRRDYAQYQGRARSAALAYFDLQRATDQYAALYRELVDDSAHHVA
jgi:glycosyltransferase involved in cell wall biosynthesis